jgi:AcrR family transcriptional regulator
LAAEDTRTKILDTAERLFAEEGFAATSLRTITAEAGVNLASVNYHFGSKEALLFAVLGRRIRPMNEVRLRLLDEIEAEAEDNAPDLEKVVRAFLEPAFESLAAAAGDQGAKFVQLIGRTHVETNDKIQAMFVEQFKDVIHRFTSALNRIYPELSMEESRLRMFFVVGAMAHTLAWSQKIDWFLESKSTKESVNETLVQFVTAGIRGSVPVTEMEGPNENKARS